MSGGRHWAWACAFALGTAFAQDDPTPTSSEPPASAPVEAITAPAAIDPPDDSVEARLLKAWELAQAGELAPAPIRLEALLSAHPNFHLAWLLYGDVLSARSGGRAQRPLPDDDPKVAGLMNELQRRLIARDLASDAVPDNLIYL